MKKKKNAREKRVLIGAVAVAGVMIAGSTFAWFSSSDEVTNRLTASADYGVSLVEDFTPPENWTPGQTINKDVSVVNTGNEHAFAKLSLGAALKIKAEGTGVATSTVTSAADVASLNLVELKSSTAAGGYSEQTVLQAGGYLAYAPEGVTRGNVGSSFSPTADGLYLFRRQVNNTESGGTITKTYDYSGYYRKNGKNYALKTEQSPTATGTEYSSDVLRGKGETLVEGDISSIKLRNYVTTLAPANTITWDYSKAVTEKVIGITYHPDGAADTTGDIKVIVNLSEYVCNGTVSANSWQFVDSEKAFYYTDDIASGDTTNKLVDGVTLDSSVKSGAYQTMDFELTVKMNSVQVTKNTDEKEIADSAKATFGVEPEGAITYGSDGKEIATIKWKKSTATS